LQWLSKLYIPKNTMPFSKVQCQPGAEAKRNYHEKAIATETYFPTLETP